MLSVASYCYAGERMCELAGASLIFFLNKFVCTMAGWYYWMIHYYFYFSKIQQELLHYAAHRHTRDLVPAPQLWFDRQRKEPIAQYRSTWVRQALTSAAFPPLSFLPCPGGGKSFAPPTSRERQCTKFHPCHYPAIWIVLQSLLQGSFYIPCSSLHTKTTIWQEILKRSVTWLM